MAENTTRRRCAENDARLHPLFAATDARETDAAIEALLVHAEAVMNPIAAYYRRRGMLDAAECDDFVSAARLRLFRKLRQLAEGDAPPIETFDGYVAQVAYHAANDLFRARNPRRTLLKRRIYDTARRDARFAVDITPAGSVCRLRGVSEPPVALTDCPAPLPASVGDAIEALLQHAGAPLLLNDIVVALSAFGDRGTDAIDDGAESPLFRLEVREDVERLWNEILLLPLRQRVALLLNLRSPDGDNVVALFVLIGITTFDAFAAALELRPEELAALWNDLPLDDLTIAARLGLTRQQVINLRKAARLRLERRTQSRGGK